ncbi:hypothetical protein Cob_v006018 [Colletotrichum orbiculare MAFF 240422]|uniref:Uncharacterized protein n=1 Tax=Colletotrichum orbiculare (strain 104-T / ATCC 96160 / CBS 514.97 / LARS 414 / MAFF 240422) TaxID=1213857 RepID=A0A484FTQ9_COLOR|nr:hypothetical protein Cob_v006018 [Colletotrichum orbiculare MAFF 240422]
MIHPSSSARPAQPSHFSQPSQPFPLLLIWGSLARYLSIPSRPVSTPLSRLPVHFLLLRLSSASFARLVTRANKRLLFDLDADAIIVAVILHGRHSGQLAPLSAVDDPSIPSSLPIRGQKRRDELLHPDNESTSTTAKSRNAKYRQHLVVHFSSPP